RPASCVGHRTSRRGRQHHKGTERRTSVVDQLVYAGPNHVEVRTAPDVVEPKPDEVVVEVAYTGICGTDLHIYAGDMHERVAPGTVLGQEMSGRIAAVGTEVTGWAPGDRATVMPLDWCGECPACRSGH